MENSPPMRFRIKMTLVYSCDLCNISLTCEDGQLKTEKLAQGQTGKELYPFKRCKILAQRAR